MIYTCQKGIISYMIQLAIVRRALVHIVHDILALGYVTPKLSIVYRVYIGGPFWDWAAGFFRAPNSPTNRNRKSTEVLQHLFSKGGIRRLGENHLLLFFGAV